MADQTKHDDAGEFQRLSAQARPGILAEFFAFAKANRKWWLLPIILFMLAIGVLIILGGTAAAPFIYTLF
ncbi:MAG: hypothetical protein HZB38_02230 [Planctomycetes bacterium]|nr:hypothetical protein [Planctomycetota bacterium]